MGDPEQLERDVNRLYGLPLDEFVPERDVLSRALAAEGRRDEARDVKGLRKPSKPAWVVNQLARENRREVDLLLDASHRLRQIQEAGGETGDLAAALRAQREAVAALVAAAETRLRQAGGAVPVSVLRDVESTLRVSAAAEEGRELLARGRLTQALGPSGFELLGGSAPPKRARRAPSPRAQTRAEDRREQIGRAERELRSARGRAREAARAVRDAETAESKARRALAAAAAELARARAGLAEAEQTVEQAEAALAQARRR